MLHVANIVFLLLICSCMVAAQSPTIPPDKGYYVHEIRGGVYWVSDGAHNTMFVVSNAGVIVVDPLPTLGDRYLQAIRYVVYPGFMPYKNLGITEDVRGLMETHAQILAYDFDTLVAGHVTRLGTREDVKVSHEFLDDLRATATRHLASLTFPPSLQRSTTQSLAQREHRSKWDLHNEYEKELIERCYTELKPPWQNGLLDTETYLRDNCWAMIEALTVAIRS